MTAFSPRTGPAAPERLRARRRSFLFSCALGTSLILAAHPDGARAQAVNATPNTAAGNVTYSRFVTPTPGTETVTVETQTAIIDWTPPAGGPPGPYIFLPDGNVLTFQNGLNTADFVVLNRILTLQPSRFDGTVIGRLRDAGGNVTGPGGTILFSSPGGIIVGPNAVFDVGSLVLTTLDVVEDGYGNFVQGGGFSFEGGDANPNAAIVTEPGAQIVANAEGSYVAMVAPRIDHGGSARVNGSVAYIAAEAASFTVNDGLFDIFIGVGSDNAVPIEHSGTTGGPASTGGTDNHAIYAVAVPKNQAITMLLQGSMGFDPAVDASVENGVIILSAGYGSVFGEAVTTSDERAGGASILIQEGTFSSDVFAYATDDAFAGGGPGDLDFLQDVSLFGGARARLFAGVDQAVSVGGDALVSAARDTSSDSLSNDVTGGEALAFAETGGTLTVDGDLTVDASGFGEAGYGASGDGTGGTAGVYADGGTVSVGGDIRVVADGEGAGSTSFFEPSGDGFGGSAYVEATNGGSVAAGGAIDVSADGTGGSAQSVNTVGAGVGGSASMTADGGTIAAGGGASLTAIGTGGINSDSAFFTGAGADGAAGSGGTVTVTAAGGGAIDIVGALTLDASGFGGNGTAGAPGGAGGTGQGGSVIVTVGDATLAADTLDILVAGFGGIGGEGEAGYGSGTPGGAGGAGIGGIVDVDVGTGGTMTVADLLADAVGIGGTGGAGSFGFDFGGTGGTGGTGSGGFIEVRTSGGTINVTSPASILISAIGIGGDGGEGGENSGDFGGGGAGGDGGAAVGGNARLISVAGTINGGSAFLTADAYGGLGGAGGAGPISVGGAGGRGGDASSGEARITSLGGDIALGDVVVAVNALGGGGGDGGDGSAGPGDGGDGGDATAGIDLAGFTRGAYIVANGEGGSVTVGAADIYAIGTGGAGGAGANGGAGGDGSGGTAQFVSLAGTLQAQGLVSISTKGLGGAGGSALANGAVGGNGGAGGDGVGGFSLISTESGASAVLIATDVEVFADGQGGDGGSGAFGDAQGGAGGDGGDGTAGEAQIFAGSGPVTTGDAVVHAVGTGGSGGAGGGADPGLGTGGSGGAGGIGTGGSTRVLAGGATATLGDVDIIASGFGGTGGGGGSAATAGSAGAAGDAVGGFAQISAFLNPSTGAGAMNAGDVSVTVEGDSDGFFTVGGSAPMTFDSLSIFGRGIGSGITFANGTTFSVNGDVSIDLDADIFVYTIGSGLIDVGGAMTLLTPGDIVHNAAPDGSPREGNIRVGSYDGNAGGDYRALGATIESADFITILATGAVEAGTLDAGGAIEIDGASIDLTQATSGGDIDLAASGDIVVGTANAGDDFLATAGGAFTGGTVTANVGSDIVITSVDDLRLDNGAASGVIDLESTGGSVLSDGLLDAGTDLTATAALDIDFNQAIAGRGMTLDAGRNVALASANAFNIDIVAGGAADLGTLESEDSIFVNADSITLDSAIALFDIQLTSVGDLLVNFAQAGETFLAAGNGTIRLTSTGGNVTLGFGDATGDIDVTAAGDIDVGTAEAGDAAAGNGSIRLTSTGGNVTLDRGDADIDIELSAAGDIDVGAANADRDFIANAGGNFTGGSIAAIIGRNIIVNAGGDLTLDNATASGLIDLTSTGGSVLSDGLLDAGTDLSVLAAVDVALTNVEAGNDILLEAPDGAVSLVDGSAGNNLTIAALVSVEADTLVAGSVMDIQTLIGAGDPAPPRTVTLGTATAGNLLAIGTFGALVADSLTVTNPGGLLFAGSSTSIDVGTMSSGGDVELQLTPTSPSGFTFADARGGIAVDVIDAAGNVIATNLASGIVFGTVDAGGTIAVTTSDPDPAFGGFTFDDMTAGGEILVAATGDVLGGDLTADGDIEVETAATLTLGAVESTLGDVELEASGSVTVDILRSGASSSIVSAFGDIAANQVEANTAGLPPTGDVEGFYAIAENGNIAIGSITADNIGLGALGNIQAGTLTALDLVLLFAGGDVTLGSVDTDGLFYLGSPDTLIALGGFEDFDRAAFDALPQLASGGNLTITGTAEAGEISLAVGGAANLASLLAAGDIVVTSDGNLRLDQGQAGGLLQLSSASGDVLSGIPGSDSTGSLSAGADLLVDAAGEIAIGDAQAGGSIALTAGEDVSARDLDAVQNVAITAGGDIDFRNLTAQQGDVILALAGNLTGTGTLTVGSSLDVTNDGDISFAALDVGEDIRLTSNEGSVLIGQGTAGRDIILRALVAIEADTLFAGGNIDLDAGGDIVLGFAEAGGDFLAAAGGSFTAGRVNATGLGGETGYGDAGEGNIFVDANGDIRLDNGDAAASMRLTSTAGDILSGEPGSDGAGNLSAGEDLLADAAGDIVLSGDGNVQAGASIDLRAGGDVTAIDLTAGTAILVEAGDLATFEGTVSAPDIFVTSADIAILDGAQLGGAGATDNVFLTARPANGETIVGGDEEGEGYTLTEAEADRIVAAALTIEAQRGGGGDDPETPEGQGLAGAANDGGAHMIVRDLTLAAARIRQLALIADQGTVRVEGGLLLGNAGADNSVSIRASDRIEVVTPSGSVRVRDAAGLPAGTLTLTSANIWAVDADLLAQLQVDPNFEGRNEALDGNDGEEEPRGYIEAGDVEIFARDTLFVQNTGSASVFAGITVTGDTLTITPTGESPLEVYAFGRRINPDGSFVTNSDFFNEVVFEQGYGAGFTETAEFNQCLIATASCPVVIRDDPVPGNRDTIEESTDGPDANIATDLVDTSFSSDPLIEEPVTSGGDSALWDCDRDEDGDCDEDDRDE